MVVFRIQKSQYGADISGEGARRAGGRWNKPGVPMLYTASSISLSVLEMLVHVPLNLLPDDFSVLKIEIPDDTSFAALSIKDLPDNWREFPAPISLQEIGNQWIKSKNSLFLVVPSVAVPQENNLLINPLHAEFQKIKILETLSFPLDSRLIKSLQG